MKLLFLLLTANLLACSNLPESNAKTGDETNTSINDTYIWTRLADSAPWKKSYNFQLFSIRDTLWVFHHDGNWFSADGLNWIKSPLPNIINNLAFLDYVYFKDAVYGLGNFNGNIEHFVYKPAIYRTSDGKHWDTLSQNSDLPARFFYHPFVFDNKIWILGGEDKQTRYADIWNSTDGIHWTKQKDHLPFGKRSNSQVVSLDGKLYLLNNDVWSSTDALNWQQETGSILPGENVFGYNAVIFDNKIWLLGCNRNGRFSSKVLFSGDGKKWQEQDAPWSARGGVAATVFNNKIYITGGKYGGTPDKPEFIYSNDIWALSKQE